MATNRSKIVSLTTYGSNKPFTVSSVDIITFQKIGADDTTITYSSNRGTTQKTLRVTETVAALVTACTSNLIEIMTPLTLANGVVKYFNIDRIISVDALSASGSLVTRITYDAGLSATEQWDGTAPTPANVNSVTDNTFNITTQATDAIPSRTRYINNLFIKSIVVATGGSKIFYDNKTSECINIPVTQSVATLKAAINLL